MPPKKGMFRAIKVKAKSGRGGMDAADTWAQFMEQTSEHDQYASVKEQFDKASAEDKEAAKGFLNELCEEFGDQFYDGRQFAMMAWTECDPEQ